MFEEKCVDLIHIVVDEYEKAFVDNEYRINRMRKRVDDKISKINIQSHENICYKTIHYAKRFQSTFIS